MTTKIQRKLPKKYRIPGLTPDQQRWLHNYERSTMLEPLDLDELANNPSKFNAIARWNISHFEDIADQAMSDISTGVPWNPE